jgi:predicted DNA-binding ribbon-helix-helix protein
MCRIFIEADSGLYQNKSRSIRLGGVSTSIRLEMMFWYLLEEIAGRDKLSVSALITRLYDELVETGADISNFSSFLRVSCSRYLALQISGGIPSDCAVPIRGLDADWVLGGERIFKRDEAA